MSVFTLTQIKPLIGVSLAYTADDTALQACLDAVESHIQSVTRLRLAPLAATEWYPGNWCRSLRLRNLPVSAVTAVRIWTTDLENAWGQGTPTTTPDALIAGDDYFLKIDWQNTVSGASPLSMSGLLVRPQLWPGAIERRRGRIMQRPVEGPGNVQIAYTAGFPANQIPAEFLVAVAAGTKFARMQAKSGGLTPTSEGLDGYSHAFSATVQAAASGIGVLGEVQSLIAKYTRPFIR